MLRIVHFSPIREDPQGGTHCHRGIPTLFRDPVSKVKFGQFLGGVNPKNKFGPKSNIELNFRSHSGTKWRTHAPRSVLFYKA